MILPQNSLTVTVWDVYLPAKHCQVLCPAPALNRNTTNRTMVSTAKVNPPNYSHVLWCWLTLKICQLCTQTCHKENSPDTPQGSPSYHMDLAVLGRPVDVKIEWPGIHYGQKLLSCQNTIHAMPITKNVQVWRKPFQTNHIKPRKETGQVTYNFWVIVV